MDVNTLRSTIHWLEYSYFTLNTEQYLILTNSLILLQNDNHFKKVYFWGIIQGVELDYYIAFGYKNDCILDRTYFYSDDCQEWKLLPTPQSEHFALTSLCRKPFQGDSGLVMEIVDDAPPEDDGSTDDDENKNDDQDESERMIPGTTQQTMTDSSHQRGIDGKPKMSRELKEEDRLAATVHIITEETAINPRGGVFKQTDGVNVPSQAFEGLSLDSVDELCSFQHCRVPKQEWNTNLLSRIDYNYAFDFLDTIDKDLTKDCWQAQVVEGSRTVILRNLHWPGYMFFHHLKTKDYGFIYVGNGQRNLDIPFMTQVRDVTFDVLKEKKTELQKISKIGINRSKIADEPTDPEVLPEVKLDEPSDVEEDIITSA